jgi:hypothetical protein
MSMSRSVVHGINREIAEKFVSPRTCFVTIDARVVGQDRNDCKANGGDRVG